MTIRHSMARHVNSAQIIIIIIKNLKPKEISCIIAIQV